MIIIRRFLFCFGLLGLLASCMETTGGTTSGSTTPTSVNHSFQGVFQTLDRKCDNNLLLTCEPSYLALYTDQRGNLRGQSEKYADLGGSLGVVPERFETFRFSNIRAGQAPRSYLANYTVRVITFADGRPHHSEELSRRSVIYLNESGVATRVELDIEGWFAPKYYNINHIGQDIESKQRALVRYNSSQHWNNIRAMDARVAQIRSQGALSALSSLATGLAGTANPSNGTELASGTASNSTTPPPLSAARCIVLGGSQNSLGNFYTIRNSCSHRILVRYCSPRDPSNAQTCPTPAQLRTMHHNGQLGTRANHQYINAGATHRTLIETKYGINYYAVHQPTN